MKYAPRSKRSTSVALWLRTRPNVRLFVPSEIDTENFQTHTAVEQQTVPATPRTITSLGVATCTFCVNIRASQHLSWTGVKCGPFLNAPVYSVSLCAKRGAWSSADMQWVTQHTQKTTTDFEQRGSLDRRAFSSMPDGWKTLCTRVFTTVLGVGYLSGDSELLVYLCVRIVPLFPCFPSIFLFLVFRSPFRALNSTSTSTSPLERHLQCWLQPAVELAVSMTG